MPGQEYMEEYLHRIHAVQDYIENHIDRVISVEELAAVAGFSQFHFSRIFSALIGESLAHYVNRIRMEHVLFELAHRPDKNMTDIAYDAGFTDCAVFSRAFRKFCGMSPTEYRKQYSKNCKEPVFISEYNKSVANKKKWEDNPFRSENIVSLVHFESQQAVYVRHTGTYESLEKEYAGLLQSLMEGAGKQQLIVEGQNELLAMYHDNPEFGIEEQFRTSLCLTVPKHLTPKEEEGLGVMDIPGGLYAVGHFRMKQELFEDAWDFMYREWLMTSGYVPRNLVPFEVYCNNPEEDKEHLVEVDICVPVEPISS